MYQLFCSTTVQALYLVAATVQEQSHIEFVWASYKACVDIAYACLLCAMIRVRVCKCVRVCVLVCWNPKFHLFVRFALLVAAAVSCRLYHTVPQALKLSILWQQQQSHKKFAWTTTCHACVDIAHACVL